MLKVISLTKTKDGFWTVVFEHNGAHYETIAAGTKADAKNAAKSHLARLIAKGV